MLGFFAEESDVALQQLEVDAFLVRGLHDRKLRLADDLPGGHHVLRDLHRQHPRKLLALGAAVGADCFLQVVDELLIRLQRLDLILVSERILVVVGVVEDACQRVVVVRADGVVLVVVAAGAADGQPEETAGRHVDAVVALVGACNRRIGDVEVPRSAAEKAETAHRVRLFVPFEQIAGELRLGEQVVGHVVVERLDHPIAVDVGRGVFLAPGRAGREPARIVLAIARHVEPVATPALAVVRRCEQPVDDLLESVGRGVVDELLDLFGRRRQSDQVEAGAAEEPAPVGHADRRKALFLELGEDEAVDVGLRPTGRSWRRHDRTRERPKRPEGSLFVGDDAARDRKRRLDIGPLGAAADPRGEAPDFGVGEPIAVPRHLQVFALVTHGGDQQALLGVAGDDRRTAAAALQHTVERVEPQAAVLGVGVARKAPLGEQWADAIDEDLGRRRQPLVGHRDRGRRIGRPGRVHADPFDDRLDLGGVQLRLLERHLLTFDLVPNHAHEQAIVGVSGNDGGAGVAAVDQGLARGNGKTAQQDAVLMAFLAFRYQDRPHAVLEEVLRRLSANRGGDGGGSEGDQSGASGAGVACPLHAVPTRCAVRGCRARTPPASDMQPSPIICKSPATERGLLLAVPAHSRLARISQRPRDEGR